MLLVVSLCFVLSFCDLTHSATRVIRKKHLIYADYSTGDGNGHVDYNENHMHYCNEENHALGVNEENDGHGGYNGIIVQNGLEEYSDNNGYNGNKGHIGNGVYIPSGNVGYNENTGYDPSDNVGHNENAGYNPSNNLGHNENTGYNPSGDYYPETHDEGYDPNGHAIAILYEGAEGDCDHESMGTGQQLNPYGAVQGSGMIDQGVEQPNPWSEPIMRPVIHVPIEKGRHSSDGKDASKDPSSGILGRDAQVEITGILHKVRLPDFVTDSSNPHEKLEAVKQHLKDRQNGDDDNDDGKENNDNLNNNENNINTDDLDGNNQNNKEHSNIKETNSEEKHYGRLNIQVGDRYDDKNVRVSSHSREENGDSNGDKNERVSRYSIEERVDRYGDKDERVPSSSREEKRNIHRNKNDERVSSYHREEKVSAYGRAYDDNSESKESKNVSKDEEKNLDDNVQEGSTSEEGDDADDDVSDEEDGK